ncbi:glycosyltransferase [bacterium]|nr:glycosyltransferase [bacterium]
MTAISIISRQNGVGLDRDVALIGDALGPNVSTQHFGHRAKQGLQAAVRGQFGRLLGREQRADLCLLVERVSPLWCRSDSKVAVLPNQERFPRRHLSRLKFVDLVLCKTRHAVDVFSQHTSRVTYTGFTSCDRHLPDVAPDFDRFFHLAGRSTLKATETILDVWGSNPDWPTLTIVQHASNAPSSVPRNVNLIADYIDDFRLQQLQNEHGIHLCPSRSEGWGHYIVEAMSCGAVVVTTDGPPMNELVTSERGILVPWHTAKPRHLGVNYFVDPEALETAIQSLLTMRTAAKSDLGEAARNWYGFNDRMFRRRFREVISDLTGIDPSAAAEQFTPSTSARAA